MDGDFKKTKQENKQNTSENNIAVAKALAYLSEMGAQANIIENQLWISKLLETGQALWSHLVFCFSEFFFLLFFLPFTASPHSLQMLWRML